jgi:phosphate/sulfate permease
VSFAHGSNDGQKGMGLILLALIGFLPAYYSMDLTHPKLANEVHESAIAIDSALRSAGQSTPAIEKELLNIKTLLDGKSSLYEVPSERRWEVRQSIFRFRKELANIQLTGEAKKAVDAANGSLKRAIEYIPFWVIVGVALALGIGTTIGYKRIVVTIAEKIGKTHLTYAQGAAAETVAAITIGLADFFHMPVSTTHVLSSGIAGTMWANKSGIQGSTIQKILLAWILTLPAAVLLGGLLFFLGSTFLVGAPAVQVQPL